MAWIDTLRTAIYGNPPSVANKPSRETVFLAASELDELIREIRLELDGTLIGVESYPTAADLPTSPTPTDGTPARVYDDTTPENNTFWIVRDGAWVIDEDFVNLLIAAVEPLVTAAEDATQAANDAATQAAAALAATEDAARYSTKAVDFPFSLNPPSYYDYDAVGRVESVTYASGEEYITEAQLRASQIAVEEYAPEPVPIFVGGDKGGALASAYYNTPAIPAIAHNPATGRTHFMCEGRYDGAADMGRISVFYRYSDDGGDTLSAEIPLIEDQSLQGDGVTTAINNNGNVVLIWDHVDKEWFLVWRWNRGDMGIEDFVTPDVNIDETTRIFWVRSNDDMQSWFGPGGAITLPITPDDAWEMTAGRGADWHRWYPGPGNAGVCMADGTIVFAGWAKKNTEVTTRTHVFLAKYDRLAEDFTAGPIVADYLNAPLGGTYSAYLDEPTLVETDDNRLYMNARRSGLPSRRSAVSSDGGETWDFYFTESRFPDPGCQGSILRFSGVLDSDPTMVLFANNAVASNPRRDLTFYLSVDGCNTFPFNRKLYPVYTETVSVDAYGDPVMPVEISHDTGYSCITKMDEQTVGCLYETTYVRPDGGVVQGPRGAVLMFAKRNLKWLTRG